MAHKTGAETFVQGLLAAYGYMVVLAVFDTCFLDWILFANIKRIRLPMDLVNEFIVYTVHPAALAGIGLLLQ